ncbi:MULTISPECIES: ABC transporter permease [unclassified Arcicella]|uniref:ABC transporter permease n=1 Tax=unclassified Arcicella TaxID=2644986 RepID=UPI0028676DB8|nr:MULTISPECIES: ABC transporter permease [unclassified Arcicella]MDR6562998.1 putative ABC transport system permease protein [Arcicella sp. BE51]MDR6813082.1 putative ABC transport system permease protein [Arcicella sp. BE140]MDR6824396.1 putative ABC transport system permease protein [Arcicella sp. BE139]
MKFLRQLFESLRFAWQALRSNLLRTVLSLLGVTIGIFSIVAVFTVVDSMNMGIREQIDSFGKGVVYVGKWPWVMSNNYPWWKYINRPSMKYNEFKYLSDNLENSEAVSIMDGRRTTLKNGNNSMETNLAGVSQDYNKITDVPVETGRYFLNNETDNSAFVVILGAKVKETLFPDRGDVIGETIKINGIKFKVIAMMKKKGEDLISLGGSPDERAFIPYTTYASLFQKDEPEPDIAVKAYDWDKGQETLEGEVTGLMRSRRGLKPTQDNNFSINRLDGAVKFFESIFASMNVGGACIAFFSLLIGGFGIANIMFVSVKERTNIIGIQKSLGAKNYFILFQFLFEAVFLSLIGGAVGIFFVWLLSNVSLGSLKLVLTFGNIMIGVFVSTFIGVLSGIVPAWVAARLDPVIAIRSK